MKEKLERYTHFIMSMTGGFFGGFTIINFCNSFGNAQTVNMINTILAFVGKDFLSVCLRLTAIVIYFVSFALSVILSKYTRINTKYLCLVFELITVFLIAFMPRQQNILVCVYPIFFIMPFQWSVFSGANGFNASTIFSSNNFRQFATALTEYFCTKDSRSLTKAKFYFKTLSSYHTGVLMSAMGTLFWKKNSIFLLVLPLLVAGVLIFCQERVKPTAENQTADLSQKPV